MKEDTEPAVEIKDVFLNDIQPEKTKISVKIGVKNPLPINAAIKKVHFKIYRLAEDGHEEYIGEGEETEIKMKGLSENILEIPVALKNRSLVFAAASLFMGDLTVIVRGSLFFDLKIFAPEIKFEERKVITGFLK